MRVAYFSEALPPIHDGVCHTLSHLTATLDEEGVAYRIVSGVTPDRGLSWRHSVHTIPAIPFPLYPEYRMSVPIAPRVDAALDRFRPDLLHVANPSLLGVYGLSYGKRRNLPVVASYHTNYVSYFPYYRLGKLRRLGWWLLRRFHAGCRATYAPSRATLQELRLRRIPRVELWQRGVRLDTFHPRFRSDELRRSIGAEDLPVLLYVGRLVREKDLDDLVRAAGVLSARGNRFRLVFVGDGPMRSELARRLPDAVFTGYRTGVELSRWYASADLFVFPSTTETFGNVLLEALASELPVIGTAAGGPRDLVEHGRNGFLARPRDPEHLAETIEAALSDPARLAALRSGARETARRFDWGTINRRLLASYEGVIRDHRAAAPDALPAPAAERLRGLG